MQLKDSVRGAEDLLGGFGTEAVEHFGRSLRDHLTGTWQILRSWDAPADVCTAGLFHSIYGTATFQAAAVPASERTRIRAQIGERAETLAYLFCMADRKRLLLENPAPPYHWVDHRTGRSSAVDESTLVALVTLEVANFLEQLEARPDLSPGIVRDMQRRFTVAYRLLPDCARRACRSAFPGWPEDPQASTVRQDFPLQPSPPLLASFEPFLIAANVRGRIDSAQLRVGPGRGEVGDLVLGEVIPPAGRTLTVLDQQRRPHAVDAPKRVLAVLGPRDSSTHTCAIIPLEGLDVYDGAEVRWVAGESGIVGQLEREAHSDSIHRPEFAPLFRCTGLVFEGDEPVNIRRFCVQPRTGALSTPVVLVAATSTEAGKTVLTGQLVRRLTAAGLAVGALKATGTGGVMDSLHHAEAGAVATLDAVDAGLITTHGPAREFSKRIPLIFRQMQDKGVDLILAELGGDLVSANNPEIFANVELMANVRLMLVICNDALGAAGVQRLNETRLGFSPARILYLSSPFRNHAGMARRMKSAGVERAFDPRSDADLAELATMIAGQR